MPLRSSTANHRSAENESVLIAAGKANFCGGAKQAVIHASMDDRNWSPAAQPVRASMFRRANASLQTQGAAVTA
jgi:hypothetical protein